MSIERVSPEDLLPLLNIASFAVHKTVEAPADAKPEILEGISENIKTWHSKDNCAFFKYTHNELIVGFVLIKDYWNFSDIFVLPEFHSQGVGRKLVEHALNACRLQKSKASIRVNASKNAVAFYRQLGFKETIIGKVLPYDMVPFEYHF